MALKYDQWKTTPITSTTSITISGLSLFGHTPPDGATPTSLRARASDRDRLLSLSLNGFDGERERRVADSLHRLKIQCFDLILYRDENYDLKVLLAHIILQNILFPTIAMYGVWFIGYLITVSYFH